MSRGSTRWSLVAASAYVLWQLLTPALIALRPGRTGRDFSWDMFSHHLQCRELAARARVPGQPWHDVSLADDFASYAELTRVLVPGRVELYGVYLCARLREVHGPDVELRFVTACRADRNVELAPLVEPTRDFCVVP